MSTEACRSGLYSPLRPSTTNYNPLDEGLQVHPPDIIPVRFLGKKNQTLLKFKGIVKQITRSMPQFTVPRTLLWTF